MFLPSTKRRGKTGQFLNEWTTCHLRVWMQHLIWRWIQHQHWGRAIRQPHLLTQRHQKQSTGHRVSTNKKTKNNTLLLSIQNHQPTTNGPTPTPATNLPTPATDTPIIQLAFKYTPNNKNGRHGKCVKEQNKIAMITNDQLEVDKRRGINLLMPPSDHVPFIYNMPHPKGGQPCHPNVTQDNWDEETV